ncbi:MAG: NUDIX domain-containing protein [Anaerolineales bacterium]|nr:NUDIX domain-containing protein [Anaerolineales bacterium]
MELCDIFDKHGTPTGRIVERGTELSPDEFYLVVQVWIQDEHNNYLIQQRGRHLESGPGIWATTAGYVLAGEQSIDGAIREVKEELGIQLSLRQLTRMDRHTLDNRVEDVWVANVIKDSIKPIPGDEVADCKWVSKPELAEMVDHGSFFRYSYITTMLK